VGTSGGPEHSNAKPSRAKGRPRAAAPAPAVTYKAVSAAVTAALKAAFGSDALVETEPAPGDALGKKVFVLVVSSRFNGKSAQQKQNLIWKAIRAALDGRESRVSLAIARGTDELW